MKVHFKPRDGAPEFNTQITDWVRATSIDTWGSPPIRIGVIHHFETGGKDVYMGIVGCDEELSPIYAFLESLGLVDLGIYTHPQFNCIYGLAGHMPALNEKWTASCLVKPFTVIESP